MPTILDKETLEPREVSQAEFDRLLESDAVLTHKEDQSTPGVRLWDNLENQWTNGLPQDFHFNLTGGKRASGAQYYAGKLVHVCTACGYAGPFESDVKAHATGFRDQYRKHRDASITLQVINGQPRQLCGGCGESFPTRKAMGEQHLRRILEAGPHEAAQVKAVQRFTMAPPASPVVVLDKSAPGVPEASPVVKDATRRRRKRRRRR